MGNDEVIDLEYEVSSQDPIGTMELIGDNMVRKHSRFGGYSKAKEIRKIVKNRLHETLMRIERIRL